MEEMRKKKVPAFGYMTAAFSAFLAVEGICLLYGIRYGNSSMFSNSVFCLLAFGGFLYAGIRFFAEHPARRLLVFGLLGGLLFSAMTCLGYSLHYTDTIWQGNAWGAVLCLTPVCGLFLMLALRALERRPGAAAGDGHPLENARKWYLLCWLLLFLCWVPVLLASWPGIFSYDSGNQLITWVDGTVNAHHPILHTALLGVCRDIGLALGGTNQTGALLYSLVQMIFMSAMYADVCLYLRQRCAPRWLVALAFLFLGLHPTNGLMALCATKDSLFTAVFAVFLVQLFRIWDDRERFFASVSWQIRFCINLFFLFALRNNGIYTFALCIPFLLIAFRRWWKRMLLLCVLCLGLYGLYTGPVYKALGIEKGDPREMCCVLMQTAARAWNLDYQGLTEEEKEAFLSVMDEEGLNSYLSWFADPVKAYFHGNALVENPGPFMRAWISVGMRHKRIYIDAFLANTYGYWYPGNALPESDSGVDYFEYVSKETREDIDVVMEPKWPALSEFYRKISNEAAFTRIPVISAIFSIGAYTWLWIFACLAVLYRRQRGRLLLLIPLGAYFFTTLLGPIVKMRYHYPFFACAPLLLYLLWMRGAGPAAAEEPKTEKNSPQ